MEKPNPDEIRTNLINAGIYVLEPQVLDLIPPAKFCDFGRDVFPGMLASGQPIYAMEPEAYIWDVGTPERLKKAQADYQAGKLTVGGMEKR